MKRGSKEWGMYEGPPGASRVLVVDDEPTIRLLFQEILGKRFAVAMASTGEEALSIFRAQPPDVMLLDKNLPGISGIEVLQKVKELSPEVEVIIMTGYSSLESAVEALRLGACDYVTKPLPVVELITEKVRLAAERKRLVEDRRQAVQSLKESEARYRLLAENATDVILTTDLSLRFTYFSPSLVFFTGHTPEEALVLSMDRMLTPASFEAASKALSEDLEVESREGADPKRTRILELELIRKDGSTFWAEVHTSFIHGPDGRPTGVLGVSRDITGRRKMEARIAQNDRMASVGVLAAGVAHEINNPLSFVLYNTESLAAILPAITAALSRCWPVLCEKIGQEQAAGLFGKAQELLASGELDDLAGRAGDAAEGAARIHNIVRGLKTFARAEEDHKSAVSLNQVVEATVNMAFHEIKYRARLVKDYGNVPPVLANEGRLAQVFLNLLVNAAQAIDEGDVEHNVIRIATEASGSEAVVSISDTGKGIKPEHIQRLFEPFFTTKPAGIGTGLGLSICYNIVSAHGGHITVESQPGKGSCFKVHFPLAAPDEISKPAPAIVKPGPAAGVRGRVLVVDDEPMVGSAVRRTLRTEHDVTVVASGSEAQEILNSDKAFDLILCDLVMPRMSGMDLFEWLEQAHPELTRRVVFITGGAFTERAVEFLRRVTNQRLDKPFDPMQLKAMVRDMLNPPGLSKG